MKSTWTIPLASLLLTAGALQAEHYKLFILTGQSNSLGTTNGGEADPTPETDAADQHIKFAWHNVADASTSLGNSAGIFTTLQQQQGGFYSGSATHWGPEIGFSRNLFKAGVRNFGVIKASRGGGGNSNWSKSEGGHMYSHVVTTVTTTTTTLTSAGHTFEIVGLLYLQGESDSTSEATIAGTRLKELVDNLRADLPNASSLHAISGGIARSGSTSDTVRANHAAIASSTSYIDYFSNLDQASNTASDNLHFNKAAKFTIGQRFANAFFSAGIVSRHYGNLAFIGDSITQGGGNGDHPSYRYQVFENLANAAVPIDQATGYKFVGSVNGPYNNSTITAPDVNGQTFENVHDGHWGWRSFWSNARQPLPAGRYNSNNLGNGTLLNWTGQSATYETENNGTLTYSGSSYVPDTVSIMIGINDTGSSSATQIRDDIGLMIDQLRAANANVRIHLSEILYSNNVASSTVDAANALLPQLVLDKNTASTSSPVWLTKTNEGFDASTMTYDNTHPNSAGEKFVGDIISAALGLPESSLAEPAPPHIEADSSAFTSKFEGNEIWDGSGFVNSWTELGTSPTKSISATDNTDLVAINPGAGASWIDGTNTGWNNNNSGDWTFETRMKFTANSSGYVIWLGTGSNTILVEIYGDRTQDTGGTSFNVAHNNLDGEFHTWRIAHETGVGYHVWRDGVRLTATAGVGYDNNNSENRLILGDYTSGAFGNNYATTIDYVRFDQTAGYLPTGADADGDTIPDSWEYFYYDDVIGAVANDDDDQDEANNLDEYLANTDPTNKDSRLSVGSVIETSPNNWDITIPHTSPQRNYTLFQSIDLGITDAWSAVPSQGPIAGTDGDLVFSITATASKNFYRVDVTLP